MDYVIEVKLPSVLLNQAERAAKSLETSANDYLQDALREKVDRWIRNQTDETASYSKLDCVPCSAKLPDELLSQAERAAASLGLSVDDFLHQALQEKVNHLPQDVAHKKERDRAIEHIFEKNGELFRRLAQWPNGEKRQEQGKDRKQYVTEQGAKP